MKKVTLKEGTMQEQVSFDGLEGGKIEYTITGLIIIAGELFKKVLALIKAL